MLAASPCGTFLARAVPMLLFVAGCGAHPDPSTIAAQGGSAAKATPSDRLRVMSLNLGHGRGGKRSQILLGREVIEQHLDRIAELIRREAPDVVALQEADKPSLWSGGFDHVEYLAERTGLPHFLAGSHARSPFFDYGTALLAREPLLEPESVAFPPSFPTLTKGYVRATVVWPGGRGPEVDVVSVHLDFSREAIREQQARVLIEDLSARERPVVLMGDLNAEWDDPGSIVPRLARNLELQAYRPKTPEATYPRGGSRLDWILIGPQLAFDTHYTLPDQVSDHNAVVADLRIRVPAKVAEED